MSDFAKHRSGSQPIGLFIPTGEKMHGRRFEAPHIRFHGLVDFEQRSA
jgi:hypothetical protein